MKIKKDRLFYLYIKESPVGLKYLGFTQQNPYKYTGSGKYWKLHLKYHNITTSQIKTTILLESNELSIISFWGMYYSKIWDIVKDDKWANLKPESADIIPGVNSISEETKLKISKSLSGRKLSKSHSINISNN